MTTIKVNVGTNGAFDFKTHNTLNKKIWDGNSLKKEVHEKLLEIAKRFINFLDLDLTIDDIEDITITGSLANYNYTKYSDIDLHIIIDYDSLDENRELIKNLLLSRKYIWNNSHDIRIKGYEVELYPQNSKEAHYSTGVYSVLNEKWVKKPLLSTIQRITNVEDIKRKYKDIAERISALEENPEYEQIKKLVEKIKKMRRSGLEVAGEFSIENLTFKVLRRKGHIGKLFKLKRDEYDKQLSLMEVKKIIREQTEIVLKKAAKII